MDIPQGVIRIYDLLLADVVSRQSLAEKFPGAKIEDASDFIHRDRISIELDVDPMEYFRFLLDSRLALGSMFFQSELMEGNSQLKALTTEWIQASVVAA